MKARFQIELQGDFLNTFYEEKHPFLYVCVYMYKEPHM